MKSADFMGVVILVVCIAAIAIFHYAAKGPADLDVDQADNRLFDSKKPNTRPDFKSYKDVTKKKHDFFSYMLPQIQQANRQTALERKQILSLNTSTSLGAAERDIIKRLAKKYRVPMSSTNDGQLTDLVKSQLLAKVDTLPPSLILAQSANESAWGTSRFATQANNFFGIWCFTQGCGLKPKLRDEGLHHEVAYFESVQEGVSYYVRTINSHPAYKDLRALRLKQRQKKTTVIGHDLAEGLIKYSERGDEYIKEIQAMIRYNKLQRFDLASMSGSP
ncbi:MAG: glucosaminidase domain-containing protein [Pseudomonadales bacterium]|jgi:Bax protein